MDGSAGSGAPKPKLGPEPTLLSRTQVDALYKVLSAVTEGLDSLRVPYIMTGGSLLGAVSVLVYACLSCATALTPLLHLTRIIETIQIRQKSILFCDDDVDLAIVESNGSNYQLTRDSLPAILGDEFHYSIRPWEGGDRVRLKACSNCFLDIFTVREYKTKDDLIEVIGKCLRLCVPLMRTALLSSALTRIAKTCRSQEKRISSAS